MRTTFGLFAAWTAATLLAIAVAAAAIGSVRTQLVDDTAVVFTPSAAALAAIPDGGEPDGDVPVLPEPSSDSGDDVAGPEFSATSNEPTTTTLPDVDNGATPSTTVPPATTPVPTTSTAPTSYSKSFVTDGGTVRIKVNGNTVTYVNSKPNLGWKAEVKDEGPEKVEVEFEMNEEEDEEEEIKFTAKIEDGELEIKISQD